MKPTLTTNLLAAAIAAACAGVPQAARATDFPLLFSRDAAVDASIPSGEIREQMQGITQVRLPDAGTASFVGRARYQLRDDGSVELQQGSVTVATGDSGRTIRVHMPNGVVGDVSGPGAVASFSVDGSQARGHVLGGIAKINGKAFGSRQFWKAGNNGQVERVIAMGAQTTPGSAEGAAVSLRDGGVVAASEAGFPVGFANSLAAAGASTDLVAAARRVQLAVANPSIASFPSGDFQLLVAHAARLSAPFGEAAFPGASADIIRAYLHYLASGGSGADFIGVYAGLMAQYVDLVRTGANPANFEGASHDDILAFLSYQQRVNGFSALGADNRALLEAYLAFLRDGGVPANFVSRYTDLVGAYFAYLRDGGVPAQFGQATQATLQAYLEFLSRSNLLVVLPARDQALLQAYLASLRTGGSGFDFASQYGQALSQYYAYLMSGHAPSEYGDLDLATLRSYLETLRAAGLWELSLGDNAAFFAELLAYLETGAEIDRFPGLPNNYALYAEQLQAYYAHLAGGGLPADYTALDADTLLRYLRALIDSGQLQALLGDHAEFLLAYYRFVVAGHAPDLFPQLPAFGRYAEQLRDYYAYLAGGGLPAGYTALDADTLLRYLRALIDSGQLQALLGDRAEFLLAYYQYIAAGHAPDLFPRLPAFNGYEEALRAYYAYLMAGGKPSAYTALTLEQIRAYIDALERSGLLALRFSGDIAVFLRDYYAWLASGGNPDLFASLPQPPSTPPVSGKVQISTAMNMPGYVGKNYASSTTSAETVSVDGNQVPNGMIPGGGGDFSIPAGATAHEVKNTDYIHVGRLTNATFVRHNGSYALGPNQGLHYGFVPELSNIPTSGAVNYKVAGATRPTWSSGALAPGYFEGRLAIAFGSSEYRVAIQGQVTMPGDANYTFSTPGGVAAVATQGTAQGNQYAFGWVPMDLVGTGRACSAGATCGLETNFQLGGDGGTGLTLTYLSWSNNAADDAFAGAVGFHKDSAVTPPPPSPQVDMAGFAGKTLAGYRMASMETGKNAGLSGAFVSVTADDKGIVELPDNTDYAYKRGTARVLQAGAALDVIAWSRWSAGWTGGVAQQYPGSPLTTMAWKLPTNLPTSGTASYSLIGGADPIWLADPGKTGKLTGSAVVAFGASTKVGFDLLATFSDTEKYTLATAGGIAAPSVAVATTHPTNPGAFAADGSCGASCNFYFNGGLAGVAGSHMALTYIVKNGGGEQLFAGQAAFAKGATTPTPPATGSGWAGATLPGVTVVGLTNPFPVSGLFNGVAVENVAFDHLGILKTLSTVGRDATNCCSYVGTSGNVLAWSRWGVDSTIRNLASGAAIDDAKTFFSSIVIGQPYTAPTTTGRVDYALVGGVNPMEEQGGGMRGMLEGTASVAFGSTPRIAFDLTATMPASMTYRIVTPGFSSGDTSLWMVVDAWARFNSGGAWTTGGACAPTCYTQMEGALAGTGGSHIALRYSVEVAGGDPRNFAGLAAFAKVGWTPPPASIAAQSAITPMASSLGSIEAAPLPGAVSPPAGWQRWDGPTPSVAALPDAVPVATDSIRHTLDASHARESLERMFRGGIRFDAQR